LARQTYLQEEFLSRTWTIPLAVDARCTSSRTPARDPGNAHRGQGAADDGFGGGDEAVRARDLKPFAEFQANAVDNYRQ
jgi:hypothetical protein